MDRTARLAHLVSGTSAGRRAAALRDELRARRAPRHWTSLFGGVGSIIGTLIGV